MARRFNPFALRGLQKELLLMHGAVRPEALGHAIVRLVELLVPPTRAVSFVLRPFEFIMPLMYSRPENLRLFQDWVSDVHREDLWLQRAPPCPRRDRVVRHTDHTPDALMVRTPFYRNVCIPYRIRYGAALLVWRGNSLIGLSQILRDAPHGDFTDAEMQRLKWLHPHVVIAVRRHFALHGERAMRLSLEQFIHSLPEAMVLLDRDLKPVQYNAAAVDFCARWNLGAARARSLKTNGHVEIPAEVLKFCRGLKGSAPNKPHVCAKAAPQRLSCQIRKVQLPSASASQAMYLLRFEDAPPAEESAVTQAPPKWSALTPRERELALLVCEGKPNRQIALELCKSSATVRNQLHSIYEKLHISRRAQLIAQRWN